MRTLVDIRETQIQALDELSRNQKLSRAALIREAIDDYLSRHRREQATDAFGLWGNHRIDGLAYQERMRSEW